MKTANGWFVLRLNQSLDAFSDEEAEELHTSVNSNAERDVRDLLRRFVIPTFLNFNPQAQEATRDALGYFLATEFNDWESLYASQSPVALPEQNPRLYFQWLWSELFGDAPYLTGPASAYVVSSNLKEFTTIMKRQR